MRLRTISADFFAFFEDRAAPPGAPAAWCFENPVAVQALAAPDEILAALRALGRTASWTVLSLNYELAQLFDAPLRSPKNEASVADVPLVHLWHFASCRPMTATEAEQWLADRLAGLLPAHAEAGLTAACPDISFTTYCAAIAAIQDYIRAGDCYQVNFTFPLRFQWYGHPLVLYSRLRARQPVRYGGFVGNAHSGIVSLSPELFVERIGDRLRTRPMKGTAPRNTPPEKLRHSVKDRAENLMIVDLLRNDLGRIAELGSVTVDQLFAIESYPSLWQMVSEISARAPGVDFLPLMQAMFPCGSITGAPKIRAMQIIDELELGPRGLYTGALGWVAPTGDCRLNVAIRTLTLSADGRGTMGVGSGIVADSDAASEWQECQLKAAFLSACDSPLQLIETLRLEKGAFPHGSRHLARMQASAGALGFSFSPDEFEHALAGLPTTGCWRVRLSLDRAGQFTVQHSALAAEPDYPVRYARLSATPIDSASFWQRHKTTVRAHYDAALNDLPPDGTIFDTVFLNERGEVAEGARSTVFVEREGVWLTPPLASGALPGVLRASLLATGAAQEAVLWPEDLVPGFALGNALRGLIRVRLLPVSGDEAGKEKNDESVC